MCVTATLLSVCAQSVCVPCVAVVHLPQLFERTLRQFNRLYVKKAYLANFKGQPMFKDSFDEFEDARYGALCHALTGFTVRWCCPWPAKSVSHRNPSHDCTLRLCFVGMSCMVSRRSTRHAPRTRTARGTAVQWGLPQTTVKTVARKTKTCGHPAEACRRVQVPAARDRHDRVAGHCRCE